MADKMRLTGQAVHRECEAPTVHAAPCEGLSVFRAFTRPLVAIVRFLDPAPVLFLLLRLMVLGTLGALHALLLPAAASSALLASSKPKLRLPAVFLSCPQPFPSSSRVAIPLTQRGSL